MTGVNAQAVAYSQGDTHILSGSVEVIWCRPLPAEQSPGEQRHHDQHLQQRRAILQIGNRRIDPIQQVCHGRAAPCTAPGTPRRRRRNAQSFYSVGAAPRRLLLARSCARTRAMPGAEAMTMSLLLAMLPLVAASPAANLSVVWGSPTAEPCKAHRNTNGPVIGGGMPLGNGELAVLAFPLVPVVGSNFTLPNAGGFVLQSSISFFVSMTTAMASDTSLFKLGMVSLVTDPPLFEPSLTAFEQRLDMERAIFTVRATSKGGRAVVAQIYVDANSNTISVSLNSSEPLRLSVRVQSVHPPTRFAYAGGFLDWMGHSASEISGPDVFEAAPGLSSAAGGTVPRPTEPVCLSYHSSCKSCVYVCVWRGVTLSTERLWWRRW